MSSVEDSVPLNSLDPVYCATYNGPEFCTNEPLFLWKWNASTNGSSHILSCAATKTRLTSFVPTKVKLRRHKFPCSYYSNSMATFHLPLVGDLVYKLNPGPVDNATRNPGETNNEQSHKRITGKRSNNIILHINCRSLLRHAYWRTQNDS